MRMVSRSLFLLLVAGALSGCIGDGEQDLDPEAENGQYESPAGTYSGDTYRLATSLLWATAEIEILLVPPGHGPIASTEEGVLPYGVDGAGPFGAYLAATLHVMEDWRHAIDQVAENDTGLAWFADLAWNIRIVGQDDVTPQDIGSADIVKFYYDTSVTPKGAAAYVGPIFGSVGLDGPHCVTFSTLWNLAGFQDDGELGVGYGSFTYEDMYNLAGHELLHCFGMSHPDDMDPREDIMSYEAWPSEALRCPSNLNVLAAAGAFAGAFDGPGLQAGTAAELPVEEYEQYCDPENDPRGA
jgi:hypothetical protein